LATAHWPPLVRVIGRRRRHSRDRSDLADRVARL